MTDIELIAKLSQIDEKLDEMHDELGDLPKEVKRLENLYKEKKKNIDSLQDELDSLVKFESDTHVTFAENKDREDKLGQQQYDGSVRNNKEFDAITKEIEHLRSEKIRLESELATNTLKIENLKSLLHHAIDDIEELQEVLTAREQELAALSSEQNEEFKELQTNRDEIIKQLRVDLHSEYERIRSFHNDAAVVARKGASCSGCFSAIQPQRQVEMRNNPQGIYTCINCGRILYPETLVPEDEF